MVAKYHQYNTADNNHGRSHNDTPVCLHCMAGALIGFDAVGDLSDDVTAVIRLTCIHLQRSSNAASNW